MAPAPTPHTFSLIDGDGESHNYSVRFHPGREGAKIMRQLLALGLPALVAGLDEGTGLDGGLARALDSFDDGLIAALLRYTQRDGVQLSGVAFDKAYQRNYFELTAALWEVITANRFLPLPATWERALRERLGRLNLLPSLLAALDEGAGEAPEAAPEPAAD